MGDLIAFQAVRDRMMVLRGQRVMLSNDLAELYGVEPRALVQAVKRNADRFPDDFMFRLNPTEWARLRSQTVILETGRGQYAKYAPMAFTEHGVAMLSSVLRSRRAVHINIEIVRAFVHLRRWLVANRELGERLEALERKYDGQFKAVFHALDELAAPPSPPRKPIGFRR